MHCFKSIRCMCNACIGWNANTSNQVIFPMNFLTLVHHLHFQIIICNILLPGRKIEVLLQFCSGFSFLSSSIGSSILKTKSFGLKLLHRQKSALQLQTQFLAKLVAFYWKQPKIVFSHLAKGGCQYVKLCYFYVQYFADFAIHYPMLNKKLRKNKNLLLEIIVVF